MSATEYSSVAVIDDDPAALASLQAIVTSMNLEFHSSTSAEEFLEFGLKGAPSCVVLDLRLPGMNGLDLLEQLAAHPDAPPVIFITGYATVPLAVKAMRGGAFTLLEKPCRTQDLKDSILNAIEHYRETRIRRQEIQRQRERFDALSDIELRVARGIAQGISNAQLSQELGLGLRTVEKRRQQVFRKLGVEHLPAFIRFLYQAVPEFVRSLPSEDSPGEDVLFC